MMLGKINFDTLVILLFVTTWGLSAFLKKEKALGTSLERGFGFYNW